MATHTHTHTHTHTQTHMPQLSIEGTEDTLRLAFSKFGAVEDVRIMMDRDTGKSRGFAFVT